MELGNKAIVDYYATVDVAGGALIDSDFSMHYGTVNLAADAKLAIARTTVVSGGTLNVVGRVHQEGNATVNGPTTINGSGSWDMDGTGGNAKWYVNDDLTLNMTWIENGSTNWFDGRIYINGSGTTMTVNTSVAWTMSDRLVIDNGGVLVVRQVEVDGCHGHPCVAMLHGRLGDSHAHDKRGHGTRTCQSGLGGPLVRQR